VNAEGRHVRFVGRCSPAAVSLVRGGDVGIGVDLGLQATRGGVELWTAATWVLGWWDRREGGARMAHAHAGGGGGAGGGRGEKGGATVERMAYSRIEGA
jgi:hypothetical protein